jgi:Cytochrome P460
MKYQRSVVLCGAFLALAAGVPGPIARAGGDKIAFPEGFREGVLFTTVDRADNKQYRELFTSPEALAAAKAGQPLPDGTVITLVQYRAQLDGGGNPLKDAGGRFAKGDLIGYTVMEKRAGWGVEYPENIRNGEWEYQAFTADRKVNDKANLTACFQCHKPLDKQDFVFSYDQMKSAAR